MTKMNRTQLMTIFLTRIKNFAQANPERDIDYRFVYSQLIRFNLPNNAEIVSLSELWPKIAYNVTNNEDKKTYSWQNGSFLVFNRGNLTGNEIKIYVPMAQKYISENVVLLEQFMREHNIFHQLKVAKIVRNDDVVIRVNTLADAHALITFITQNIPQAKRLNVNPFLANYDEVGLAMDNNRSFNTEVSSLIADYITSLKQNKQLDQVSLNGFRMFVFRQQKELAENAQTGNKLDLLDIYRLLGFTTTGEFSLADFYQFANEKQIDKYTVKRERIVDPEFYLEQAFQETAKKYPQNGARAIKEYIQGNPMYFTNNNRAREGLIKYVKPELIETIMKHKLQTNGYLPPNDLENLINNYLNILYQENSYAMQYGIIKQAYLSTYDKYGYGQAHGALYNLLFYGDIMHFTDALGYRHLLAEKVYGHNIAEIFRYNLADKDINDNVELFKMVEAEFIGGLKR